MLPVGGAAPRTFVPGGKNPRAATVDKLSMEYMYILRMPAQSVHAVVCPIKPSLNNQTTVHARSRCYRLLPHQNINTT